MKQASFVAGMTLYYAELNSYLRDTTLAVIFHAATIALFRRELSPGRTKLDSG